LQCGKQRWFTVGGDKQQDLFQLGGKLAHPGCRGAPQELLGDVTEGQELFLRRGLRPRRPGRLVRSGVAVVLVDDADLARCDEGVFGDDLASERLQHTHRVVGDDQQDADADEAGRDRVAG
jgi:hypothetical protein